MKNKNEFFFQKKRNEQNTMEKISKKIENETHTNKHYSIWFRNKKQE